MKRSTVKKRTPQNKNKNTLVFGLLLVSVVTAVVSLLYFQSNKQNREHSDVQAAGSGWLSGASCNGVPEGTFASWRGSPVTIAGTWNDGSLDSQKNQYTLGPQEYGNWDQSIDVTIGAFWGSSWANAANGGDDANLHAALAAIDRQWGNKKTIFIRYAHEFNGDWDQWKVMPSDNADYIKAFDRFYNMVQTDLVAKGRDAKVVWSPNSDDHNGIAASASWPGDNFVDVVGVDYYDWSNLNNQTAWTNEFMKNGALGGPLGVGAWQAFAKAHGKPIAFPEWGTSGYGPQDDKFFIQQMNEFFRTNAGTGPGQVWYEIYFNCGGDTWKNANGEQKFQIYPVANLPETSAMYKSLKWGDGGISGTTPGTGVSNTVSQAVSPTEKLITPSYGCVGGINCVPSSSPAPSDSTGGGGTNPSESPSISSNPSISLSLSQFPGQGGGSNGGRGRGGFFQMIWQFFMQLIAFLLSLIGVRS